MENENKMNESFVDKIRQACSFFFEIYIIFFNIYWKCYI